MKRAGLLFLLLLGIALAVAGWQWFRSSSAESGARPNLVLITIDTLRADRLGRGLTPNIDRVAARGVSVPNVRATAPLTLPSHASLMTGTIPPVHGVRENGVVFDRKTATLAAIFKQAGYRTGAFVGAYVLNRRFGLDEGFDTYDDAVRRDAARAEQLEAERPAGEVIDAALGWLNSVGSASAPDPGPRSPAFAEATAGRPESGFAFFLWVHVYDPHAPYAPPAGFLEKAGGNAYDAEVAYVDAQIGRLLDALESRGLAGNTLIAITGDHGESLGEHGEQTHGMLVYDGALRVPLILAGARTAESESLRCHQDLAGTLLRLAGLEAQIPQNMARAMGNPGDAECSAYSETLYPRRAGWHALTALTDGRWKLILSSERELYDVSADPAETRNIAAEHFSVADAMATALTRLQSERVSRPAVAPEAAERLRALGYVGGSAAMTSDDPGASNPARVIGAWTEFERALATLQDGRASDALPALSRLASSHPGAPVFQSTYAQALREAGRPDAAVAVYKAAVAKWPSDPALFHDLAAAARDAGDSAEAVRAEQAALALDSTSPMAHNGMGLLHADAGRLPEAVAAFERATQGDPTNASYWANLGNARREIGDASGAELAYRKALQVDPSHTDALNGLGVMYVQSGRAGDAVPLFERALQSDGSFHEARLNLGIAYQESGQREKAAATYRQVLATAPASAQRERQAAAELLKGIR